MNAHVCQKSLFFMLHIFTGIKQAMNYLNYLKLLLKYYTMIYILNKCEWENSFWVNFICGEAF